MVRKIPSWVRYIHKRIENNKNFIGAIIGPTGSGKSFSGLSIAEMLDPEFNENKIIFRTSELLKLINSDLKSGSVILWDEAGIDISNRDWQSITNKVINYLLQTFRSRNFILIFTVPYADFLDSASRKLFHAQFETQRIDFHNNICTIKPKLLQYNSNLKKWYYHYLKVLKNGRFIKIKKWKIPRPSKKMIKIYERKKGKFTKDLYVDLEKMIKKAESEKEKSYQIAPLANPLTDLQATICNMLKEMNGLKVAKKLGIKSSTIWGHMTAMKKKGVIFKPIVENGIRTHYIVENVPEQPK